MQPLPAVRQQPRAAALNRAQIELRAQPCAAA